MPLGGKESYIVELANYICKSFKKINIVPLDGNINKSLLVQLDSSINITRLPIRSKLLNRIYCLLKINIASLIKSNVIHLNDGELEKYILFRRAKIVTYVHGFFDHLYDPNIPKFFANKTVQEFYTKIFTIKKSRIIPPMLVTQSLLDNNKKSKTGPELRICLPGRIEELKGQLDFIKNFSLIFDKNVTLNLIGDIDICNEDFNLELESNDYITHNFFLPRNEYIKNLDNYDIITSSSYSETFGIAIVEGILKGLYPILPKIPVFEELVQTLGYGALYEQWNPDEFSNAIDEFKLKGVNYKLLNIFRKRLQNNSPLMLYED